MLGEIFYWHQDGPESNLGMVSHSVVVDGGSLVELATSDYRTAKRQTPEIINFNIFDACKSGL